jgi:hypothetical protein
MPPLAVLSEDAVAGQTKDVRNLELQAVGVVLVQGLDCHSGGDVVDAPPRRRSQSAATINYGTVKRVALRVPPSSLTKFPFASKSLSCHVPL